MGLGRLPAEVMWCFFHPWLGQQITMSAPSLSECHVFQVQIWHGGTTCPVLLPVHCTVDWSGLQHQSCPSCLITHDDQASALPCLHEFCFRCLTCWVKWNPECCLCTRPITAINSRAGDLIYATSRDTGLDDLSRPLPIPAIL